MYEAYKYLKSVNKDQLYLFKCGNFYIFISDDCEYVCNYMVLKKTKFNNDFFKCGFPISKLNDYLRVMSNNGLKIEVVEDYNVYNIKNILKNIDIDKISFS